MKVPSRYQLVLSSYSSMSAPLRVRQSSSSSTRPARETGRRKGSSHSTVNPVVGGLRSGCHLLDFVDSLFGVGICSIRRMVV